MTHLKFIKLQPTAITPAVPNAPRKLSEVNYAGRFPSHKKNTLLFRVSVISTAILTAFLVYTMSDSIWVDFARGIFWGAWISACLILNAVQNDNKHVEDTTNPLLGVVSTYNKDSRVAECFACINCDWFTFKYKMPADYIKSGDIFEFYINPANATVFVT